LISNIVIPQALWFRRVRGSVPALFALALVINVGMWLERFIIIVLSLSRDFLPSSWGMFRPTFWDWSTFLGSIGLFAAMLFLFIRFLPMISIFEMRTMLPEAGQPEAEGERSPTWGPQTEGRPSTA
jgi:molybdopterin-containing oxidoreductase family membrane subunit